MTSDEPLPYAQVSDQAFAEFAAGNSVVRLEPDERDPERILIAGSCARCHHDMTFRTTVVTYRDVNWAPIRDKIFDTVMRNAARRVGRRVVTVYCRCGRTHPGAPDRSEGCGAYWNLNVEWGKPDGDPHRTGTAGAAE